MNVLVFLSITLFTTSINSLGVTYQDVVVAEWREFKSRFAKNYSSNESVLRMKVYMENKHKIAVHNEAARQGKRSFTMKINKFGDLLHHEFVKIMNGFRMNLPKRTNGSLFLSPKNILLPNLVDWRKEGYVTPVKDQGECGSCWSFSSTGALEGQHFRKTGHLVSLSEQNLIDCSKDFGNNGCEGGLMDNAFEYVRKNNGIDTEVSYPYEAKQEKCRFKNSNVGATATGFVDIPTGDEKKLLEALATVGPIAVAIDASHESFQFYSQGVYDEENCSSDNLDHGVLIVGYGEEDGRKYWIVKNSWGNSWGEGGYIRMSRDKNNQCGIATQASYPLV